MCSSSSSRIAIWSVPVERPVSFAAGQAFHRGGRTGEHMPDHAHSERGNPLRFPSRARPSEIVTQRAGGECEFLEKQVLLPRRRVSTQRAAYPSGMPLNYGLQSDGTPCTQLTRSVRGRYSPSSTHFMRVRTSEPLRIVRCFVSRISLAREPFLPWTSFSF
jgi:hypothetical protein